MLRISNALGSRLTKNKQALKLINDCRGPDFLTARPGPFVFNYSKIISLKFCPSDSEEKIWVNPKEVSL